MIISLSGGQEEIPLASGFIEFVSHVVPWPCPARCWAWATSAALTNGVFRRRASCRACIGTGAILVIGVYRAQPAGGNQQPVSRHCGRLTNPLRKVPTIWARAAGKVFTSVTLPLIKDSFLSGLVTTFVRSITAISAIILLVTPSIPAYHHSDQRICREGQVRRGLRLRHHPDRHCLCVHRGDELRHQAFRNQQS